MKLHFKKYVGCGNDFILLDNRTHSFPIENRSLISQLCHRQYGIGADGIILLETSMQAHFRMRIFNADGSEAEMCGNGIRCFVRFLETLGYQESSYQIETMHRILKAKIKGSAVCIDMGDPIDLKWNIPLNHKGQTYRLQYLNTGVPHVVIFTRDVSAIYLEELGPYIRYSSLFVQGTNVNVAQIENDHIKVRTYERGVEGETLACGTGATAVALAAAHHYGIKGPITIHTRSDERLLIDFKKNEDKFTDVTMTGPAQCIFEGVYLSELKH